MAEKRAAKKAGKTVEQLKKEKEKIKQEKKIAKESAKGAKQDAKQRKTSLAEKRRIKKQQEALNKVMSNQKRNKILDEFNDKKCEILSKCTNIDVFNKLNKEFNEITDEDVLEGKVINKLKDKLKFYETEENIKLNVYNNDSKNK